MFDEIESELENSLLDSDELLLLSELKETVGHALWIDVKKVFDTYTEAVFNSSIYF